MLNMETLHITGDKNYSFYSLWWIHFSIVVPIFCVRTTKANIHVSPITKYVTHININRGTDHLVNSNWRHDVGKYQRNTLYQICIIQYVRDSKDKHHKYIMRRGSASHCLFQTSKSPWGWYIFKSDKSIAYDEINKMPSWNNMSKERENTC